MKLLSLLILFPGLVWAKNITIINGKTYSCNGSMSIVNGVAKCNGVVIDSGGTDDVSSCGPGVKTKKTSGGGEIDLRAKVDTGAIVKGVVCGQSSIAKNAIINRGAVVNGVIQVDEGAVIGENANLNGSGYIGKNVKIAPGVNVNGQFYLTDTSLSEGTNLNGHIRMSGVQFTGDISCNGDGAITATPPVESAQ